MQEILKVKNLTICFKHNNRETIAVNNISFNLAKAQVLAIAGESGSGKTLTALSILNLIDYPGYIKAGEIIYNNMNLLKLSQKQIEKIRGKEIAIIFQEPSMAYDHFFTIGEQFYEILKHNLKIKNRKEAKDIALQWLKRVGLSNAELIYNSYPFQLSGGMQQRVMMAMALSCNPSILIADEPTSSLDVITQNAILKTLSLLKDEINLSIILITHDFGIIAQFATHVVIMYRGRILEAALKDELFDNPLHPYTKYLLINIADFKAAPLWKHNYVENKFFAKHFYEQLCPFIHKCSSIRKECELSLPSANYVNNTHMVMCWQYNQN
jgi:oligopeptide/dipeptide ABC transporter ATP-binding protein